MKIVCVERPVSRTSVCVGEGGGEGLVKPFSLLAHVMHLII